MFAKHGRGNKKTLNALLKKGARYEFTEEHTQILQTLLEQLSSARVLAFPDFPAATSGDRPFQLITDASVDELGAVAEQEQSDGTTRPICFLSRATFPNEKQIGATRVCSHCMGRRRKTDHYSMIYPSL